jgi:hypothetical protein
MSGDEATFFLLYPERKVVTATRILGWYSDALADGEVEGESDVDAFEAARILDEAGLITLGRAK